MTIQEAVEKLARALSRVADEHGRPNTFAPGELQGIACGPAPMLQGMIARNPVMMRRLYEALGGLEKWGAAPTYTNGRWSI